jgi:hypothetical protein
MQLYSQTGDDGLLNLLAKVFAAANTLDGARTGSVRTKFQAVRNVLDLMPEAGNYLSSLNGWNAAGGSLQQQAMTLAEQLCLRYVEELALPRPTITDALHLILNELEEQAYYFTGSGVGITLGEPQSNQGDVELITTHRNGLGHTCLLLPEEIAATITNNRLRLQGYARHERTDPQWPQGSGIKLDLSLATPQQSLLANADFETITDDQPANWLVRTGTLGQTIQWTEPEQQQLQITGSPTGGYYVLYWQSPTGREWETPAIPYNANASTIQTALRTIPGLELVTVSGTNPFTVTFEGTPGDISQLTAMNRLTGGSNPQVQITTTRQGDPGSYRGRSLRLVGNGSEQTMLFQTVRLQPTTVYAFFARARRSSGATGTLRFELRKGVDDGLLIDNKGGQNRIAVNVASLSDNQHGAITGTFRLPSRESTVTFVIHVSTALPANKSVYLDELILVPATQMYAGGPFIAAAGGWKPAEGDQWTLQVTNVPGPWPKAFDRYLQLRVRTGRALPTSGTTQIPDSLLE